MVVPAAPGGDGLIELAGRALLAHAVAAMEANRCTTAVVVVGHPDALEATAKLLADEGLAKVTALVAGGPTRQASVAAGLRALPPQPEYVVVHDAARPLVAPCLRFADQNLHWAQWNLGEFSSLAPELPDEWPPIGE